MPLVPGIGRFGLAMVWAAFVALLTPAPAAAQSPAVRHIGVLGNAPGLAQEALTQGLRDVGLVDGQNIAIEWRWAEGHSDRLPDLAAELVRRPVEVIVAISHRVALVAKQSTTTIPIVFTAVNDPVGVGLVASLARPEGNVTGVSLEGFDLIGKRLQLLQQAVPGLKRVAYLTDPTEPYSSAYVKEVRAKAQALGLAPVVVFEVSKGTDLDAAFTALTRDPPDGLLIEPNSVLFTNRAAVGDFALRQHLPTMYGVRALMPANGFLSYGPTLTDHFRLAAIYVDKILAGAKPADLPVAQPTKFELIINLKTAKALGLDVPQILLSEADAITE